VLRTAPCKANCIFRLKGPYFDLRRFPGMHPRRSDHDRRNALNESLIAKPPGSTATHCSVVRIVSTRLHAAPTECCSPAFSSPLDHLNC